jgi:hypothetical protein
MTKDEQIANFLTYSMEDIREENPQYIFEMWMHERRKHEAEIEELRGHIKFREHLTDYLRGQQGKLTAALIEAIEWDSQDSEGGDAVWLKHAMEALGGPPDASGTQTTPNHAQRAPERS